MTAIDSKDKMSTEGKIIVTAICVGLIVDGMDLQMLALALPSIMKELHLSNVVGGAIATLTLLGMGIGGSLAGWLSDRIGRMKVIFWSILVFSAGTAMISACESYWQIAVLRFISGFGIAAVYSVGTTLSSEYIPTRIRSTVLGIMQAGWSLGYVLAGIVSSYVMPQFGWRALFACAIVPGVVCLWLLWGKEDSPAWLASRAAIRNSGVKHQNEFARIWAEKSVRLTFIAWSLTAIFLQFGYYGANTWLPSYLVKELGVNLKNMGWFIAATYTMTVIGKIVAGWLGDIIGRRITWVCGCFATAVALPLIIYYATPSNVAYLLLIFGFLFGTPYGLNSQYLAESFPTVVRGTCVATAYNIGRIGSMVSPLMIGYVSVQYSIAFGIALLGIAYFFTAILPGLFIRDKLYDPKAATEVSAAMGKAVTEEA
ncbi:MAG: MFS transporter [Syntrophales bacterium]|nr:MFS transporter [Syntrophales bacterium]